MPEFDWISFDNPQFSDDFYLSHFKQSHIHFQASQEQEEDCE